MAEVDWRRINVEYASLPSLSGTEADDCSQFDEDNLESDQLQDNTNDGNPAQVQQEVRQLISR